MTKDELTNLIVKAFPNATDSTEPPAQIKDLSSKLADAISAYVNNELLNLKESLIAQGAFLLPQLSTSGSLGADITQNSVIPGTINDYTPGK